MPDPASDACQVYSGWLPHLVYPLTVDALKQQLAADLTAANVAATTCAGLDSGLLAQWSVFYAAGTAWATSPTSWWGLGSQMDQGQSYQCALYAWQKTLSSASCSIVVAGNPNPAGAPDAGANALKWVGVAVASVAGAWALGKGFELALESLKLVPHGKEKA